MTKIGRNDPCPCGSGKKFKKCHWGHEHELDRERETFGAFGYNPLRDAATRTPVKDAPTLLARIREEKLTGSRILPSASVLSVGDTPPESTRLFLIDACAKIVDQNWAGRSEMCIYFAVLLRHGLRYLGYEAEVEVGKGEYFYGQPSPFKWDHAWVRTEQGDLVDGNIDSVVENPMVPTGVDPRPYWGPDSELPADRRLKKNRVLAPERDNIELEQSDIVPWKRQLEEIIDEWRTSSDA